MECPNCGVKNEETAKFCSSCGTKLPQKPDSVRGGATLDAIKNHLEFLGYTVKKTEAKTKEEKDFLVATHVSDSNFVIIEILSGIINFRANFSTERSLSPGMDKAINELNSKLDVARIYYENENGKAILRVDSTYTGDYSKDIFSNFFKLLNKDITKTFILESSKNAFTGSD